MGKQCLHAGPGGEDLDAADTARRGIAGVRRRDIAANLADHS